MKQKKYIIYTILFIIISIIIFSPFYLNGRSLIMDGDASRQHFIIFRDYIMYLKNIKNFHFFSWNIGMGADIISQYSYYIIGDLFSYIGIFFKTNDLQYVYTILIIIRIYFVGISALIYTDYKKIKNYNSIILSIIYTFSAFILFASVRHPFFTNAAILFPLFLIGIEKLIKEDKKIFFTLISFLCMISNFYFCYMIFILGFIYGLLIFIFDLEEKNIKLFINKMLKIFICLIIAFLLSSLILIPTIYTFLNLNKSTRNTLFIYPISYYKTLVSAYTTTKSSIWLTIGVPFISLLFIPLLFKKKKENKRLFTYFIILTLFILIPLFASIMNGFSFPSNRFSFAYIFILSYITAKFIKDKYNKKELTYMIIILIIYYLLYFICNDNIIEFIFELVFGLLYLILLILQSKFKTKIIKGLLLVVICLNVSFNGFYLYSNIGKGYANEFIKYKDLDSEYNDVEGELKNLNKIINKIKKEDKSFYRIFRKPNYYQNLGIYLNYKSGSSYLSLLNGTTSILSDDLNNVEKEASNNIKSFDNRTKITTLLGSKYYIVNKNNVVKVPYGYELYDENDNLKIYINKYYLNPIIFYDKYTDYEKYNKATSLEKEDLLLNSVIIKDKKITNNMTQYEEKSKIKKLKCKVNDKDINNIKLNCEKINNSEIYVNIKNLDILKSNKSDLSYNVKVTTNNYSSNRKIEDKYNSAYYIKFDSLLFNLGYKEDFNDEITIKIDKAGTYKYDDIEVYAVNMDDYKEKINYLNETKFNIDEYNNDYIKGTINNQKDGILLLTTDYSKGWEVYVDSKKTKTFIVDNAFLGIKLNKGKHKIEFKYKTPYFNISIIMTLMGVIGLIIMTYFEKQKTI